MATTKRKRFGGGPLNQGISALIQSGHEQVGELNVEIIPIDRVDEDPDNPRRMGITMEDVAPLIGTAGQDIHPLERIEETDDRKMVVLGGLKSLADTIKPHGVQQPITVYRHGNRFRIITGHRRYWGSVIAEKKGIPAIILPIRPRNLRMLQFIENMQREDLTLPETLANIAGALEELEVELGTEITGSQLATAMGLTKRQANRYLAILRGPQDVREAVEAGQLTSIARAAEIAVMDDPEERAAAIANAAAGERELPPASAPKQVVKKQGRGRPATTVRLGSVKNTRLVQTIIERIGVPEAVLEDTDWDDPASVAEAWKRVIAELEKSL